MSGNSSDSSGPEDRYPAAKKARKGKAKSASSATENFAEQLETPVKHPSFLVVKETALPPCLWPWIVQRIRTAFPETDALPGKFSGF